MNKPKWLEFRGVDKVKLALQQRVNWLLQNFKISKLDDVNVTNISDGQILKYDSTTHKFVNADESGGTDVEANPSDTATDDLTKIKIDGTVYDIAGGGGSGTASIEKIWDYVTNNNGTIPYDTYTVTLSKSINNYDAIVVEVVSWYDDLSSVDWGQTFQFTINVNALKNAYKPYYFNYTSYDDRATGYHVEGTTFECVAYNINYTNGLVRVWGVKSGGGTGGTYVEANPSGTATDTLDTLQVGNTIYNVNGLPFQLVIDANDNGINIVYDDSILSGGGN